MTTAKVKKMIEKGGKKWEAYGKCRIYFDREIALKALNLEINFYKSGSVSSAVKDGDTISNSQAKSYLNDIDKIFYDVLSDTWGKSSYTEEYVLEAVKEYVK